MRKNYVIDDVYKSLKENNAGYKARDDVNDILKDDFEILYFLKGKGKLSRFIHYVFLILKVRFHSDIVVVQYPFYINSFYMKILKYWIPRKSILLIHDIDSLRNELGKKNVEKEMSIFNIFYYIISHNLKMTEWLKNNGCQSKIVELEIFDYLTNQQIDNNIAGGNTIAFAGNLSKEKSGFLYSNHISNNEINVYGSNFYDNSWSHLNYKGSFPAEVLPAILKEKYGLIWDGASSNECIGNFGRYLMFNNPHKTSLYLVSGLPVIVWDKAAIAPFIEKQNLGFSISSLDEIKEKMQKITDAEYAVIKNNVIELSKKLRNGYFLKKAIYECLEGEK